jgi:hypothetical protein
VRELIRLATIDPLTGLCNRRGFFEQATEACARVVPPDGSVSAIILDIDNFKRINDSLATRPVMRRSAPAPKPPACRKPLPVASAATNLH